MFKIYPLIQDEWRKSGIVGATVVIIGFFEWAVRASLGLRPLIHL
jgi:hypothetical protein